MFPCLPDGNTAARLTDVTAPRRSPKLGYALAATAATLWALNGSLATFLLDDHMPAARLAELRAVCAFVILAAGLAVARPHLLRVEPRHIPRLALLGIVGFAGVNAFYFAAIKRLGVGVALTIQYIGPVLLMVWLTVVHRRSLSKSIWTAAAITVTGCFFVVRAYNPGSLDGVGVAEAAAAAVTFAIYLFASEQAGHRYAPATTLAWAFGLASLFWLVTQPPWSFPFQILNSPQNLAYALYVVLGGTLIPFACMVTAVRHLPASRAAVVATLEPVLGALLAWPIHGQSLAPIQIAGGLVAIAAIIWVQAQRTGLEAELAPAYGARRNAHPQPDVDAALEPQPESTT
jgi:drug/metabolite transporter (DMT)-like permease